MRVSFYVAKDKKGGCLNGAERERRYSLFVYLKGNLHTYIRAGPIVGPSSSSSASFAIAARPIQQGYNN